MVKGSDRGTGATIGYKRLMIVAKLMTRRMRQLSPMRKCAIFVLESSGDR
jgi:hypothetical protein